MTGLLTYGPVVRYGLDATPLLGPRTGIGRYTAELLAHLSVELPAGSDLLGTAFSLRGRAALPGALPPDVTARTRPLPARLLQRAWARAEVPAVGALVGRLDLFHGTNFVLPPVGHRTAGVVTVHDLAFEVHRATVSAASRRYRQLVPRSIARAGAVCVPSSAVAAEVTHRYPHAAGRVVVTPLGIAPGWFDAVPLSPARRDELGVHERYLLFAGTEEPRKGLSTLASALSAATRGGVRVPQLVIVGPAGWGPTVSGADLPGGSVVRLGHVAESDLRSLVAGAAALVYPSLYEGFGLPVAEALACGTPVLASDIPTTVEITGREPVSGRLFPVGDVDALVDLLREVAGGGLEGMPAHRAARADSVRHLTWTATARATAEAYRRALAER